MKIRFNVVQYLDDVILFFYFVALLGFMPTANVTDRYVWLLSSVSLILRSLYNLIFKTSVVRIDNSFIWYLTIVAYGAVSCLWAVNMNNFIEYLIFNFSVIVCSVLCVSTFVDKCGKVDRILFLFIIAGLISAIRYCYYSPWEQFIDSGTYIRGSFGIKIDDGTTNYNNYTSLVCLTGVLAAYYGIVKKIKWCQIVLLVLFFITIYGGSRKTIVVLPIISFYFLCLETSYRNLFRNILAFWVMVSLSVILIGTISEFESLKLAVDGMVKGFLDSDVNLNTLDESTLERLILITQAKEIWYEHFACGIGWDNFRLYSIRNVVAHNNYYEVLASLGFIGFVIFYSYYFYILFKENMKKCSCTNYVYIQKGLVLCSLFLGIGSCEVYSRERMIIFLVLMLLVDFADSKKVFSIRFNRLFSRTSVRR